MSRLTQTLLAALIALGGLLPVVAGARAQTPEPAATPVAASDCATDPASGLVLYSAWPGGQPGGDVVVANGAGQELGRIVMPPPVYGFAVAAPGKGLIWAEADELYLVDAVAGTARALAIPAETVATLLPVPVPWWGTPGDGWAVIGGRLQPAAYLLNLDTGEAHDLAAAITALGDEYPETQLAIVAPDNRHVLLWSGVGLYLIETANPDQVRALGDPSGLAAPGFFRDGGAGLIYSRVNAAGEMEVVTEDLATGALQVVTMGRVLGERRLLPQPLPDPERAVLVWVDGQLNAVTGGAYEVLDLATGRARFLTSTGPTAGIALVNPAGDRLLAGGLRPNGAGWGVIDLITGELTAAPEVTGMISLRGGVSHSTFFYPPSVMAPTVSGEPGVPYLSLDLDTGAVQTLLLQQPDTTYTFPFVSAGTNPRLVLRAANEARSGLVLLDPVLGRARTVATGDDVAGAFSPDGCWLAAVAGGDTLTLLPVTGEESVEVRGAMNPVWLFPAP